MPSRPTKAVKQRHSAGPQPFVDVTEPAYIEPAKRPRGAARSRRGAPGSRFSIRTFGFVAVVALLALALSFVVIRLPEQVVPATTDGPAGSSQPDADAPPATTVDGGVPPYRAEQLALAREAAERELDAFVELQLRLEAEFDVDAWGSAELDRIKERANAADQQFVQGEFEAAINEYAAARTEIQDLLTRAREVFAAALAGGLQALDAEESDAATEAFAQALAMRPGEGRAQEGAARAALLPAVIDALREAERAMLREDYVAARQHVDHARGLDGKTRRLAEFTARIAAAETAKSREAALSAAFNALADGNYDQAIATFDDVLAVVSDHAAALAGRQQAVQGRTRARIDALQSQAESQVQAEEWEAALATYDAALGIDATLRFAREGKATVRERVMLIRAMDAVLSDPGALSGDRDFQEAKKTLELAEAQRGTGEAFDQRVAEFRKLIADGDRLVPLVLLSDNHTEVIIQKVGALGTFERHELSLRPGRYVIVGSQDGCRDIRKEVTLASGMAPVDIRCAERI